MQAAQQLSASLKRAERHLRRQATLLRLAQGAIIIRDRELGVVFWSRGVERLYGWSADEAFGTVLREFLQARFPKLLAEIESELLQHGCWEGELPFNCKNTSQTRGENNLRLRLPVFGFAAQTRWEVM
jgi:PAS domain-containing protein